MVIATGLAWPDLASRYGDNKTGCKPVVHGESRNWFKFLGNQAGRQLLAKVFPFSHFVMTNSSYT